MQKDPFQLLDAAAAPCAQRHCGRKWAAADLSVAPRSNGIAG